MSANFGENRDIFFPKLSEKLHLLLLQILQKISAGDGYEPYECKSEEEARELIKIYQSRVSGLSIFSKVIQQEKKILKSFIQVKKR